MIWKSCIRLSSSPECKNTWSALLHKQTGAVRASIVMFKCDELKRSKITRSLIRMLRFDVLIAEVWIIVIE